MKLLGLWRRALWSLVRPLFRRPPPRPPLLEARLERGAGDFVPVGFLGCAGLEFEPYERPLEGGAGPPVWGALRRSPIVVELERCEDLGLVLVTAALLEDWRIACRFTGPGGEGDRIELAAYVNNVVRSEDGARLTFTPSGPMVIDGVQVP